MSKATEEVWTAERIEALKQSRRAVKSYLSKWGLTFLDAEYVVQETYLQATRKIDSFDPERGSFAEWINAVAVNQARSMVRAHNSRAKTDQVYKNLQLSQDALVDEPQLAWEDSSVTIERIGTVLAMVKLSVEHQHLFERSLVLIRDFDGDVSAAAVSLGVSAAALRESHRQIMELAIVIDRALALHWQRKEQGLEDEPVRVRDLLACFPDVSEKTERTWLKSVPYALIVSGAWSKPEDSCCSR